MQISFIPAIPEVCVSTNPHIDFIMLYQTDSFCRLVIEKRQHWFSVCI